MISTKSKSRFRKYLLFIVAHCIILQGTVVNAQAPNIKFSTLTTTNNDGIFSTNGSPNTIIIHPPFYRTTFAYLLYVIFIGAILWILRRREIKKLSKKFRLQQERFEAERRHELDLMKIKFLTNLSHEFRKPISLILAPAENLLSMQDNHMASQLTIIRRNAKRLLHLVNQLMDFRKMGGHELALNIIDGDVVSFLKEIVDSFQDIAISKGIELVYNVTLEALLLKFDHDKLERVLFNLLSNAFKFTPNGGKICVHLDVITELEDAMLETICIRVIDTGIGIPAENLKRVFDRFFQVGQSPGVSSQGIGIGLFITKEYVQMHGGSITVESELNKETSFSILLGLQNVVMQTVATQTPITYLADKTFTSPSAESDPKRTNNSDFPTLLLVEDNDDYRFYLKDKLQKFYKIIDASNGVEGWNKALANHPDLIVSDVNMPLMDGLELSRKLKGDKRTSHIPIILLTGLTGTESQLNGLDTGANDCLTKPFNFEILQAKIRNLLALNMSSKNAYTKQFNVLPYPINIESSSEMFLNNVIVYIDERLNKENFSIEDLSKHFDMSRGTFYNRILEITGKSPIEFIRSYKLDRAATLLTESNYTVTEISYKAGFATPHYFTKTFKAKFNMLPSDFRASRRQTQKV